MKKITDKILIPVVVGVAVLYVFKMITNGAQPETGIEAAIRRQNAKPRFNA